MEVHHLAKVLQKEFTQNVTLGRGSSKIINIKRWIPLKFCCVIGGCRDHRLFRVELRDIFATPKKEFSGDMFHLRNSLRKIVAMAPKIAPLDLFCSVSICLQGGIYQEEPGLLTENWSNCRFQKRKKTPPSLISSQERQVSLLRSLLSGAWHLETFSAGALYREFREFMRILTTFLGKPHRNPS